MINNQPPIQGPLTLGQTEQYNYLILMRTYGVPRSRLTADAAIDLMRKAHADVMELAWLTDYTLCPITGLEDCKIRSCELHYMDAPIDCWCCQNDEYNVRRDTYGQCRDCPHKH